MRAIRWGRLAGTLILVALTGCTANPTLARDYDG